MDMNEATLQVAELLREKDRLIANIGSELRKSEKSNAVLQAEGKRLNERVEELKTELQSVVVSFEAEQGYFLKQTALYEQRILQLKEEVEVLERERSVQVEYQSLASTLEKEEVSLREQLLELKRSRDAKQLLIQNHQIRHQSLERRNLELIEEISGLRKDRLSLLSLNESLTSQIVHLREGITLKEATCRDQSSLNCDSRKSDSHDAAVQVPEWSASFSLPGVGCHGGVSCACPLHTEISSLRAHNIKLRAEAQRLSLDAQENALKQRSLDQQSDFQVPHDQNNGALPRVESHGEPFAAIMRHITSQDRLFALWGCDRGATGLDVPWFMPSNLSAEKVAGPAQLFLHGLKKEVAFLDQEKENELTSDIKEAQERLSATASKSSNSISKEQLVSFLPDLPRLLDLRHKEIQEASRCPSEVYVSKDIPALMKLGSLVCSAQAVLEECSEKPHGLQSFVESLLQVLVECQHAIQALVFAKTEASWEMECTHTLLRSTEETLISSKLEVLGLNAQNSALLHSLESLKRSHTREVESMRASQARALRLASEFATQVIETYPSDGLSHNASPLTCHRLSLSNPIALLCLIGFLSSSPPLPVEADEVLSVHSVLFSSFNEGLSHLIRLETSACEYLVELLSDAQDRAGRLSHQETQCSLGGSLLCSTSSSTMTDPVTVHSTIEWLELCGDYRRQERLASQANDAFVGLRENFAQLTTQYNESSIKHSRLRSELDSCRHDLVRKEALYSGAKVKLEKSEANLTNAMLRQQALESKIAQLEGNATRGKERLNALISKNEKLEENVGELIKRNALLEDQAEKLSSTKEALSRKSEHTAQMGKKIISLLAELESVEEDLSREKTKAKENKRVISDLTGKLSFLQDLLVQKEHEIELLRQDRASMHHPNIAENDDINERIAVYNPDLSSIADNSDLFRSENSLTKVSELLGLTHEDMRAVFGSHLES